MREDAIGFNPLVTTSPISMEMSDTSNSPHHKALMRALFQGVSQNLRIKASSIQRTLMNDEGGGSIALRIGLNALSKPSPSSPVPKTPAQSNPLILSKGDRKKDYSEFIHNSPKGEDSSPERRELRDSTQESMLNGLRLRASQQGVSTLR